MSDRLRVSDSAAFERHLSLLAIAIVLTFGGFMLRLFQLQIVEGEALRQRSERNSIRTIRLAAPRGEILDREGRVLATTRPAFGMQVIPSELRRPELTFAVLARLLERQSVALRDKVEASSGVVSARSNARPILNMERPSATTATSSTAAAAPTRARCLCAHRKPRVAMDGRFAWIGL